MRNAKVVLYVQSIYSLSQSPLNAAEELNDSYHTYNERSIKVYKVKDLPELSESLHTATPVFLGGCPLPLLPSRCNLISFTPLSSIQVYAMVQTPISGHTNRRR